MISWAWKKRRSLGQGGMSLVEVMMTMGIASGLVLAVMEAVVMVQKSARSIQVSSDWTAIMGNINLLAQNPAQCTAMMVGKTVSGCAGACPSATAGQLLTPAMTAVGPSGSSALLSTTVTIAQIRASQINLKISSGNVTQLVTNASGVQYYQDNVEFDIVANKVTSTGAPLPGGTSVLRSGSSTNNAVTLMVWRASTGTGAVVQCYGRADEAQVACSNMGGLYGPTGASPYCQLQTLQLGRAAITGAPNSATSAGQRISLHRPSGGTDINIWGDANRSQSTAGEYAIGINSGTMWFNAGAAADGFQFTDSSGGTTLATLFGSPPSVVGMKAGLHVQGNNFVDGTQEINGTLTVNNQTYLKGNGGSNIDLFMGPANEVQFGVNPGWAPPTGYLLYFGATQFYFTGASTRAFLPFTMDSTLSVAGATTLSSTLAVTGAATLSSTLHVVGASTLDGAVTVNDTVYIKNGVNSDLYLGPSSSMRIGYNNTSQIGYITFGTDKLWITSTYITPYVPFTTLSISGDLQVTGGNGSNVPHSCVISTSWVATGVNSWTQSTPVCAAGQKALTGSAGCNSAGNLAGIVIYATDFYFRCTAAGTSENHIVCCDY